MNDPKPRRSRRVNSATVKLLDERRSVLGEDGRLASDDLIAQVLRVSKSTVAMWQAGKAPMSAEAVLRACDAAPILFSNLEWYFRIAAQRENGRLRLFAAEVVADIVMLRQRKRPIETRPLADLMVPYWDQVAMEPLHIDFCTSSPRNLTRH